MARWSVDRGGRAVLFQRLAVGCGRGHGNLVRLVREHMTLQTTPACSAGLTDHAWTWEELLTFRLRPEQLTAVAG